MGRRLSPRQRVGLHQCPVKRRLASRKSVLLTRAAYRTAANVAHHRHIMNINYRRGARRFGECRWARRGRLGIYCDEWRVQH